MPIYNFRCQNGSRFEALTRVIRDDEKTFGILCKFHENCIALREFTPTRFIPFRSFVDYDMTGKPIEIGSPQQFSRELHKRGLEITDRPIPQRRKRKFGIGENTKKMIAESLSQETKQWSDKELSE